MEETNIKDPIIIKYNNTSEETEEAFKVFHRKYHLKKSIFYTFVYILLICAALFLIITNSGKGYGYLALVLCGLFLVNIWVNPIRIRKRVIKALDELGDEEFVATFYEDHFHVETILPFKSDDEVSVNLDDSSDNEIISPDKSTYYYGVDSIDFAENEDSLMVCAQKSFIYCFPKRCISPEKEEKIKSFFIEKEK